MATSRQTTSRVRREWTVERLLRQLRALGVAPGDRIFVHTGLHDLRLTRGDTPNLLAAYREALGEHGALFFPTHTYSYKGEAGDPVFHRDAPCHTLVGVWPELARKTPGAVRSMHPTHAIGAIGYDAERILAGHDSTEAVGFGSPLDTLRRLGAKVLLVGCGFESCTALHLAETYAQVPHLNLPQEDIVPVALARVNGAIIEIPQHEMPGCSDGFPKFEPYFRIKGLIRDGRIAEGRAMLCDLAPMLNAATELLRESPRGFLCDANCITCNAARKHSH